MARHSSESRPGAGRSTDIRVECSAVTPCGVFLWLESRAERTNVSYRTGSAIVPDRRSAAAEPVQVDHSDASSVLGGPNHISGESAILVRVLNRTPVAAMGYHDISEVVAPRPDEGNFRFLTPGNLAQGPGSVKLLRRSFKGKNNWSLSLLVRSCTSDEGGGCGRRGWAGESKAFEWQNGGYC